MLKRLVDVREALATTVVFISWKELMKSGDEHIRDVGALITGYIGSDYFRDEVYNIVAITKPIYKLIRFCDKDSPLMGEIYERMDNMLGEIKDGLKNKKYSDAYTQIEAIVVGSNVFKTGSVSEPKKGPGGRVTGSTVGTKRSNRDVIINII